MLRCITLFYTFFKIGLFSFGGGYAMFTMIAQEIGKLHIISQNELSNIVALTQMVPGPVAVDAAAYVGYKSLGFFGAFFSVLGVSLPCFVIVLIVSSFFNKFKTNNIVQAVLNGIRPATIGMIATAVIIFAKSSIYNPTFFGLKMFSHPLQFISLPALFIFALTIIGTVKFKLGPTTLTFIAGILGAFIM